MRNIRFVWPAAAILYLAFIGWYDGLRGPLDSDEIDAYIEAVEGSGFREDRLSLLRKFLEEDDSEDFVMVNAILLRDPPLLVEGIEPGDTAREALDRYMAYMMPALLSRASHPVFLGQAALPAIEIWGIEDGDDWSMTGLMRYRSRRDMMDIVANPDFHASHEFKIAAIEKTIAFPVTPYTQIGGPRIVVALFLVSLAAITHLILGSRRPG